MFSLAGRLAVVTGSSRGIGLGIARGYLSVGAKVVLNGRDLHRLEKAAAALRGEPGVAAAAVQVAAFDVVDEAAVVRAAEEIVAAHGCPDILVNNAGIQVRGALTELPAEDWRRVVDVNLTSAFVVGRTFARYMLARGSGKIVNICSVQNQLVRPSTAPYAAAKNGLGGLTQSMCAEWAPRGLQVNGLAPGYLDTDLNASLVTDPEFSSWITKRTPAGRWGQVDDIVGPAIWLASAASDFVNGQIIYVDGGLTAVI
ncbi:SDR family oxidoreductase [Kribbella italica]|uniref:Gluconate 5-dehydrogenase n=1 Tax=Kribbella italica TaxID=1540520 RepID=A0A7W9JGE6_9ACTN|nr:SDR family oxidoreductase [Kribbella italica]MBB5841657.1 gluconate 5-dehydrogenase [Kribbella italica]